VLPMGIKYRNHVFYVWLFYLQTICAKYGLETWIFPNGDIRTCLFDMQRSWTKNAFWDVISRNNVNGVNLFHFPYLITITAYLCSQWAQNIQIRYFMCDWSNYRQFELNTWFHPNDDIPINLFDMQRSWIKNVFWDLNNKKCRKLCKFDSPFFFNNTYGLLGLTMAPNVQIKYFMFDWSIYRLLVLNRVWKRDSHQMMIFVYVCSTYSVVEIKTRLEKKNSKYWTKCCILVSLSLFNNCFGSGH
jgi:hypothetical protein